VQALLLPAAIVFYMAPWKSEGAVVVYYVCMAAVWVALVAVLAGVVRDVVRGKRDAATAQRTR
jgi:hypothetical protein